MRVNRASRTLPIVAGFLVLLAGASAVPSQETGGSSGFLSNYSRLAPDPEAPDIRLTYRNPDYTADDFDRLLLEDIAFVVYPQDFTSDFSREKVAKILYLQQRFSELLRSALEKEGVRLAEKPGPGVLHCRWAVTNLGRAQIMADLVPQTQRMDGFTRSDRRGVTVEGECQDGESGEPVLLEVEIDSVGKGEGDFTTWPGIENRIEKEAQDAADDLVAATKKRRGSRQ